MIKSGIDQDALVALFSEASAQQGEAVRKAVSEATLKALQGRELTLTNIKKVLESVTQAASNGAAKNMLPEVDVEQLLGKALAGIDAALLQAVEAHRKALQQLVDQGIEMQNKPMKDALANIEKMEDAFFTTVAKAAKAADAGPMKGPWEQVLASMKIKGTETGALATTSVEQLMSQARDTVRASRASSLRNAQTLMESYAALVSGVLIGMSEGLQPAGSATPASKARKR
jgi:hypothetical protein